jgi:hypothetical protein
MLAESEDDASRRDCKEMVACDASGYRAWLFTEPEFGCRLWEAKDGA